MLALAIALAASPGHAQVTASSGKEGLTLSASARLRGEAIDGQARSTGPEADAAIFTRLRVGAEYRTGALSLGGELIDSRAFLEKLNSTVSDNEVNALEPFQAWVGVQLADGVRTRLGRFTINLGSRRLVAENGFRNAINSFTGARLDVARGGAKAVAFWSMPQDRLPETRDRVRDDAVVLDRERLAQQFFGAFGQVPLAGAGLDAYLFRLAERDDDRFATRNRRLWTLGARLLRAPKASRVDLDLEGAWQFGEARATAAAVDTRDLRVAAFLAHASAGYTMNTAWRPRVAAAFDLASGEGRGDTIGRFDSLYGARAFEFGPTGLYGVVARANLLSVEARAEVTPSPRLDAYLAARPLWLAEATDSFGATGVRDLAGASGRYAGLQVEGRVRRWLLPDRLRLAAGAALIDKGRLLRTAPNAPRTGDTHYGYLELTFTP